MTVQVALLRKQDDRRQGLLDINEEEMTDLLRVLERVRTRPTVSAEYLTTTLQECNQLRQLIEQHRLDAELCRRLLGSISQEIEAPGFSLRRASF